MWRQVFKYAVITVGGTFISRGFTFFYNMLIIRHLSVEHYGYFALLNSIFTWTMILAHMDIYGPVSKFVSEKKAMGKVEDIWNYYANAVLLGMVFTFFAVSVSLILAKSIALDLWVKIIFFGGLIPTTILTINGGLFRGTGQFVLSSLSEILLGFSKFAILIIVLVTYKELSLNAALIIFSIATLPPFFIGLGIIKSMIASESRRLMLEPERSIMTDILRFSFWICITDLLNSGVLLVTNYFLSFVSLKDLAKFNVIILISMIFHICIAALPSVLIPVASTKKAKGERIKLLGKKELIILYGASFFLFLTIMFFPHSENIMRYILKKEVYVDSIKYCAFFLVTLPLRAVSMANKGIVQGLGRPREIAFVSFWTFFVYSVMLIPAYKFLGISGLILALNIAYTVEFFLNQKVAKRAVKELM